MARVDLHPRAIHDAREARRFYARASVALGTQFMDELDATVSRIAATPALGSPHLHATRVWRLHRFPYYVVYLETGPDALVLAVAHNRRRPGYWSRRLP